MVGVCIGAPTMKKALIVLFVLAMLAIPIAPVSSTVHANTSQPCYGC